MKKEEKEQLARLRERIETLPDGHPDKERQLAQVEAQEKGKSYEEARIETEDPNAVETNENGTPVGKPGTTEQGEEPATSTIAKEMEDAHRLDPTYGSVKRTESATSVKKSDEEPKQAAKKASDETKAAASTARNETKSTAKKATTKSKSTTKKASTPKKKAAAKKAPAERSIGSKVKSAVKKAVGRK